MNRFFRAFSNSAAVKSTKPTSGKWADQKNKFRPDTIDTLQKNVRSDFGASINSRFWPKLPGTTYEPTDFTFKRASNFKVPQTEHKEDQFINHGINPLDLWTQPHLLSSFITTNGKIIPGHLHGRKGSTQRKLAKAIRRCRAAGLLSTVHRDVGELKRYYRYK